MSQTSSAQQEGGLQVISRLVELSKLDTLYRDLYFQRARELMSAMLSQAAYTNIKENSAALGLIERQLRAAVERGDWKRTGELTARVRRIREAAASASGQTMEMAGAVYDHLADIPVDPFSSGFHVFFNGTTEMLREWRQQAIAMLTALERSDTPKRDFYARRRADFQALQINLQPQQKEPTAATAGVADLRQEALSALDTGDLSQLDRVIQRLMQKSEEKEEKQENASVSITEATELGGDLLFSFPEATVTAAARLGLAPARTQSRRHFAHLIPYGWQPLYLQSESKKWAQGRLAHLMHASDNGDHVRDAIEFYLLNPFITSCGTHYKVCLVVEDLLVEDFDEPEPRAAMPRTELLAALGLESRWGLSRIEIENALLQHGPRILREELQLDPEAFRLVAIPPDIYTNLGPQRGWGQQQMWTHFDGYWVRERGKLHALAGGDKRFGGTHDVVSLDPAYASATVLARFAVVQRQRMRTWHQG
jgi:hypothetical protein